MKLLDYRKFHPDPDIHQGKDLLKAKKETLDTARNKIVKNYLTFSK